VYVCFAALLYAPAQFPWPVALRPRSQTPAD
jgi:hypothetical protein